MDHSLSETISDIPHPLIFGIIGASIVSLLPFSILAFSKWLEDLERYGSLFPYIWVTSAVLIVISAYWDNHPIVSEQDKGWYGFLIFFGVTMCFSLAVFCGFFLAFCFMEVISHHFRKFVLTWMIAFVTIALSVFLTQLIQDQDTNLNTSESKWKWNWWGCKSNEQTDAIITKQDATIIKQEDEAIIKQEDVKIIKQDEEPLSNSNSLQKEAWWNWFGSEQEDETVIKKTPSNLKLDDDDCSLVDVIFEDDMCKTPADL